MLLLGTATYADLDKKSTRDYQVGWTQSAQDLMLADVGMACRASLGCLKQCSAGLDTGQSHRLQRVPDNLPHSICDHIFQSNSREDVVECASFTDAVTCLLVRSKLGQRNHNQLALAYQGTSTHASSSTC